MARLKKWVVRIDTIIRADDEKEVEKIRNEMWRNLSKMEWKVTKHSAITNQCMKTKKLDEVM
jgi:hypothetical protein